ncbi:sulfur carrier protein ThiS [Nitratidesulfovibrio vulgaris]|uniref:Thiamine biosynthesis protein ThiS n=1 Tax=Nitratidesulfovibrio vulgaris (strain ATCC 29579 / DSM 644 / CCUG 34227 / NCIMB 8303 / VKM B-1760 / Hildenborough) TaxID=882 RepID=Q72AA2_NITV2|nr:sulfur carrier protein ThiS [Nitratidesulfovibrio vulgaris]AAS96568.1 thiamine biosynthesis protein ThiS [Nitratidesulfovibrio vulgaris str. Hildenborough]ADP87095.1 thiamine biosynthesis protein ThiS [Nitratidesulfovibrio vulgaris RCH1]
MTIVVNGHEVACEDGVTLLALLGRQGLDPRTVVVERNGTIVKAEAFGDMGLEQGDTLEILHFVGGG